MRAFSSVYLCVQRTGSKNFLLVGVDKRDTRAHARLKVQSNFGAEVQVSSTLLANKRRRTFVFHPPKPLPLTYDCQRRLFSWDALKKVSGGWKEAGRLPSNSNRCNPHFSVTYPKYRLVRADRLSPLSALALLKGLLEIGPWAYFKSDKFGGRKP